MTVKPFLRDYINLPLYLKNERLLNNGNVELTLFVDKTLVPQQSLDLNIPVAPEGTIKPAVEFTVEVSSLIMTRLQKPEPRVMFNPDIEQWHTDQQAAVEAYYRERKAIFEAMVGVIIDVYERKTQLAHPGQEDNDQ